MDKESVSRKKEGSVQSEQVQFIEKHFQEFMWQAVAFFPMCRGLHRPFRQMRASVLV